MDYSDILISIALDLSSAMTASSRYQRLLEALHRAIPYDAAALMSVQDGVLRIRAARGLSPDARGRDFDPRDHPRLDVICHSAAPVRFAPDSPMPDPFDGLLADDTLNVSRIHACMGTPLYAGSDLIGALTADAVAPDAFAALDDRFLAAVGALAGAEMHTTALMRALEAGAEKMGLIARDLMQEVNNSQGGQMIGDSAVMQRLKKEIALVARSDFSILVTGETGVGKELVARSIHAASRRKDKPLLYVNCANLAETLAESELFGHVKGAFTGAVADRAGKFELADGATLFLDEIGELPLAVQPKLLRVLQQGEVERVGASRVRQVDVRLIAATNRDLEKEVGRGRFRADLFHRLNVYPLAVSPLRERAEDIAPLAGHFCEAVQRRLGLGPVRLAPDALSRLKGYDWPGNVRELENLVARAVLKASAEVARGRQTVVRPDHLGLEFAVAGSLPPVDCAAPADPPVGDLRTAVDAFQTRLIRQAVDEAGGNWARAARRLGLHRSNLHKLAKRLDIK